MPRNTSGLLRGGPSRVGLQRGNDCYKQRLPFAPIEAELHRRHPDLHDPNLGRIGALELSRLLGCSKRRVQQYRAEGTVWVGAADRLAVEIGLHPAEVWGDDWWRLAGVDV